METFLSKSKPEQTMKEHIDDVMYCYGVFMEQYGTFLSEKERSLLELACFHHDDGKVNCYFQKRIKKGGVPHEQEIPHGHLSVLLFSTKLLKEHYSLGEISALYTAVYHHHDRKDHTDSKRFQEQATAAMENNMALYFGEDAKLSFANINRLLFRVGGFDTSYDSSKIDTYLLYMVVKGLLNKLDYRGSSGDFEVEQPNIPGGAAAVVQSRFGDVLLPAQKFMAEHQEENLIVVAPTGSGKTEGAMLWLGENKGFYTLPLKVSANAIYERITKKYNYAPCALLHSDSFGQLAKEGEENEVFKKYSRMKNLSYPLTICTVDQVFPFVFKSLGTEIYGATLRYSKIVIDEIQMYNSEVTAFLLYGLELIANMGGKFLIMTATFPRFLQGLMDINPPPKLTYFAEGRQKLRHRISVLEDDFDIYKIIAAGADKKVLVIVNTVQKAQDLYEAMKPYVKKLSLLHSKFTLSHRRLLEHSILEFSDNEDDTGIWITTQIVEASLDIDFDVLFTEGCTIDSLLQRFGRCYRGRAYTEDIPNIYIYFNQNDYVYDKDIVAFTLAALKDRNGMLLTEEDKIVLIDEVFEKERLKKTNYYKEIVAALKMIRSVVPGEISKIEANHIFRKINSVSVIPDDIYQKNMDAIQELARVTDCSYANRLKKQRELQEFTVSVNPYGYKKYIDGIVVEQPCISRIHCQYEFNEETLSGRGLLHAELENNFQ